MRRATDPSATIRSGDQPDQPDRVEHRDWSRGLLGSLVARYHHDDGRPHRLTVSSYPRMERTYEVAATPEQVWDAIATADGISAWMVPTRLDPQIGGEVSFDLGEFRSTGVVTDYTPNHRFAYEEPWPIADQVEAIPAAMVEWFNAIGVPLSEVYHDLSSVTPIATEFLIESASGGSCVIRVVTSAYGGGADWENEFFAEMVAGWDAILDNLATHFNEAMERSER